MNKSNDNKSEKYLIDKMLLIFSALGVGLCLLVFLLFLFKLKIKEEWIRYILICISYIVVFIYGIDKTFGLKKKVTNLVSLLLFVFFAVFPLLVGFTIFYFKLLPFPKRYLTYLIIGLISLPISALCFDKSLKFLERREHS